MHVLRSQSWLCLAQWLQEVTLHLCASLHLKNVQNHSPFLLVLWWGLTRTVLDNAWHLSGLQVTRNLGGVFHSGYYMVILSSDLKILVDASSNKAGKRSQCRMRALGLGISRDLDSLSSSGEGLKELRHLLSHFYSRASICVLLCFLTIQYFDWMNYTYRWQSSLKV